MPFHPISFECGLISVVESNLAETQLNWTKNGESLLNTDGVQILNLGNRLTLLKPTIEDSGIISCIASNQAGVSRKDFKLNILSKLN